MFDLNDLQMFARVVESGGFTAASRVHGVPKQTLSKRVAALEHATGVRLIQRSSRSFAVTDAGMEVYRHASAMLIEAEGAFTAIQGRLAEPSGVVRITASIPTAQYILAPLLPDIAKAHPRIRIMLNASDRFVDIIAEGYDIALRDHISPLPDSELLRKYLGFDEFWLVASPSYLRGAGLPEHPDEIANHATIDPGLGGAHWKLRNAEGRETVCSVTSIFYANESVSLLAAAVAHLGIAKLPRSVCLSLVSLGQLTRVLPAWTAGQVDTSMLLPHRRGQLPAVQAVANLLASYVPQMLSAR